MRRDRRRYRGDYVAVISSTSISGTVLGWYWLSSLEWYYVEIANLPSDDDAFAVPTVDTKSTPAFRRVQATRLLSSVQADPAIARHLDWAPPGS